MVTEKKSKKDNDYKLDGGVKQKIVMPKSNKDLILEYKTIPINDIGPYRPKKKKEKK